MVVFIPLVVGRANLITCGLFLSSASNSFISVLNLRPVDTEPSPCSTFQRIANRHALLIMRSIFTITLFLVPVRYWYVRKKENP
ncbi:hypothetical protein C8R45DRAFT_631350 [Mycena sanguinolenta]|nr:hypothetical protein C8R45DRAFT_631350 [Mycena sanguinolenta]